MSDDPETRDIRLFGTLLASEMQSDRETHGKGSDSGHLGSARHLHSGSNLQLCQVVGKDELKK